MLYYHPFPLRQWKWTRIISLSWRASGEGGDSSTQPKTSWFLRQPHIKVIVEKHPDGYVAYPLGLKGVVVGEGDIYEEALADAVSAIRFHIETFGSESLDMESPTLHN